MSNIYLILSFYGGVVAAINFKRNQNPNGFEIVNENGGTFVKLTKNISCHLPNSP